MDYINYKAKDFAQDEYFQQWVLFSNPATADYWAKWLKEHPEKSEEINLARQMLQVIKLDQASVSHGEIASLKEKIMQPTQDQAASVHKLINRSATNRYTHIGWAATVTLLLGTFFWWYTFIYPWVEYETAYGEVEQIILPDSSTVTLNANSILKYSRHWQEKQDRKVWLEGEAFFSVVKKQVEINNASVKFIVQTPDLAVEVLGTQFNVRTRQQETEVVLQEGKIQLQVNDQSKKIRMHPGERVLYDKMKIQQQSVEVKPYISWKEGQLVFDDIPLGQVAERIEETYGVRIRFADPALKSQYFKGTVPLGNIDVLLEALSGIYHVKVIRKGEVIILE